MLSFFVGTPALRVPAPRMELRNNIGGTGKNWRPALSRAQPVQQFDQMGGCGGASPFAAYAGGGSAEGSPGSDGCSDENSPEGEGGSDEGSSEGEG